MTKSLVQKSISLTPHPRNIMLEGGYSLLATDAMPIAKGRPGNPGAWQDYYVSLTINPTLFKAVLILGDTVL